ncbi:MAG: MGMT family protein [Planctomycetes bacterium]|nr:MGMT family protein [Planctomycetota bacterium]
MLEPERGWERFYRWVARIPRGRVATYSMIAACAGNPRLARQVGFALAALRSAPATRLPWHRVLGARGPEAAAISLLDPPGAALQRRKLVAEGVRFDARGRVSLALFGWRGPRAPRPPKSNAVE